MSFSPLTSLKILVVATAMTAFFASLRIKNTSPNSVTLFIPHSLDKINELNFEHTIYIKKVSDTLVQKYNYDNNRGSNWIFEVF